MNKKIIFTKTGSLLLMASLILSGCKKDDDSESTTTTSSDVPEVYKKIYGATDMYVQGEYVVIKSTGVPDHKSPYFQGTAWASTMYEAYNGTNANWNQNPNKIGSLNYTFKIPLNPTRATTSQATALGAIGVSLNGVPFYNQYAGPNNQALAERSIVSISI